MSEALDALANAEADLAKQVVVAANEISSLKFQVATLAAQLATPPDESGISAVTDKLKADADVLRAAVTPNA